MDYRKMIIESADEGVMDRMELIMSLVYWISEKDAERFCRVHELTDLFSETGPHEQDLWYDTSAELQ